MARSYLTGGTVVTGWWLVRATGPGPRYAVLGTLYPDGTVRCRSGAAFAPGTLEPVHGSKGRGVSAADAGWGGRIGMVNVNAMGLFGKAMLGLAKHPSVWHGVDAVMTKSVAVVFCLFSKTRNNRNAR